MKNNPILNVNWVDHYRETALHTASLNGCVDVVKLLLEQPAISVNLKNQFGQTPISFACQHGGVLVVRVLLQDPRVDVTLDDNKGRTPLWRASNDGEYEVIEWLIASGKDLMVFCAMIFFNSSQLLPMKPFTSLPLLAGCQWSYR